MVYPYNGIWVSNKKEWNTDTCNSMRESQNHYMEWKKLYKKKKKKYICMIFMWNSKKCKWIYSARKQSGYLGIGGKWVMARGWNYKGTQRNFWGDRCVLIVLSEVMVSWVHRHVKTYQIVYFKYMNLLYVNCTSIKVFFKKGNFFLNLFFLNVEMIILSFY